MAMLNEAEEVELDHRLADLHRYPLQLDAPQWNRLRELARGGDRRGQLDLLRQAEPGAAAGVRRPAPVAGLADRVGLLEQRLTAVERRLAELEARQSGRGDIGVPAAGTAPRGGSS